LRRDRGRLRKSLTEAITPDDNVNAEAVDREDGDREDGEPN
jgi:hypothetical protein